MIRIQDIPQSYYGLFMLFYDALQDHWFLDEFSYFSLFFWNSLLILAYAGLRKRKHFRNIVGMPGMILLYIFLILQLFLPADGGWQIRVKLPGLLNPVHKFLRMELFSYGTYVFTVWRVLVGIWCAGSTVQLFRLVNGIFKTKRLVTDLPSVEVELSDEIAHMAPVRTRIYRCSGLDVPFSYGVLSRRILVPDREYTEQEFAHIVSHESSHLKNRDSMLVLFADFLCVLYWWNPCVYILKRDLERCLELRCDQEVVCGMDNRQRTAYMETLLSVFRNRHGQGFRHGLSMLGNGKDVRDEMRERFAVLERTDGEARTGGAFGRAAALMLALGVMVFSYSVVGVPYFSIPAEALEDKPVENVYVVSADAYIIENNDGSYVLHTVQGEVEIPAEEADFLESEGVEVVTEDALPGEK